MTLDAMPECTEKTAMGLEDQQRPAKSLRILLVEDHGDTLHALARLLTHFGHEISVADGAQNARKIIESKEFDVVLSDIGLPDGNGYDLISEAKRRRPIKGVALTVSPRARLSFSARQITFPSASFRAKTCPSSVL